MKWLLFIAFMSGSIAFGQDQAPELAHHSSFDSGYHGIWMYHDVIPNQFTRIEQAKTMFDRLDIDYNECHTIFGYEQPENRQKVAIGFLMRISSRDYEKAKKLGWIYRADMDSHWNTGEGFGGQSFPKISP